MTLEDYRTRRDLLAELQNKARGFTPWVPWTKAQTAPPGDWEGWLFLAGRGTGKTDAGSEYIKTHVAGPRCIQGPQPHRIAIIAPTLGDARQACVEGETGILRHDPDARYIRGEIQELRWPNGSVAHLFGTNNERDVDRLRAGGNRCLAWLEEFAAWPRIQEGFEQMEFGLRSGPHPHWIATTTPKPRKTLKNVIRDPDVVQTTAKTADNPHLPEKRKQKLLARYAGTRLGLQELDGVIVEDVEGAIWSIDDIEPYRVSVAPDLDSVVVGVDPPGGATECGIVAVGRCKQPTVVAGEKQYLDHFYVLLDRSKKAPPNKWARRSINTYKDTAADRVVGETNYGGDMVMTVIGNNVRSSDGHVATDTVTATRGKKVRAEPIHDLYQQGRVHHVGRFELLEEEMTTWVPEASPQEENPANVDDDLERFEKSKWSPNRLDALVWAITYLAGFNEPRLWFG